MRIAIPIYEISDTSGICKHTMEVVKYLVKQGHAVYIYTAICQNESLLEGVRVHRLYTLAWISKTLIKSRVGFLVNKIIFILFATVLLYAKRNKFDVIWNNGCGQVFYQDLITAASCHKEDLVRKLKKKQYLRVFFNPLNYLILFLERFNYSRSRHCRVIAISNIVKQQLVSLYAIPESEFTIIYHGINLEQYDLSKKKFFKDMLIEQYNINPSDMILCFAANVYDTKGLDVLFKAIRKMHEPTIKLLVIGEDIFKKSKYQKMAESYRIDKQVFFVGLVNNVSSYMLGSDMFVFPTRIDAFGMVILEAMASGLPIITTSKAGASELLKHQESALLLNDPEDVDLLVTYITKLVQDGKLRDLMASKAKSISMNYSWGKIAEEHLGVFEEIQKSKVNHE